MSQRKRKEHHRFLVIRRYRKIVIDSMSVASGKMNMKTIYLSQEKESVEGWISVARRVMLSQVKIDSLKWQLVVINLNAVIINLKY